MISLKKIVDSKNDTYINASGHTCHVYVRWNAISDKFKDFALNLINCSDLYHNLSELRSRESLIVPTSFIDDFIKELDKNCYEVEFNPFGCSFVKTYKDKIFENQGG